jgi:hypothetical protein
VNILFVMEPRGNAGCTHALANYMRVGDGLGHGMALFGEQQADMAGVRLTTDPRDFDRVIYVFESKLYRTSRLQEVALLGAVPREHRYVLDADAKYGPMLVVEDYDRNYRSEEERSDWLDFFDALSDRILQATMVQADDPRVTTLPFFGFDPAHVVRPCRSASKPKDYDVLYVGHNWWRWKEVEEQLLPAFERIRKQVGKIGFVGLWWDGVPDWAEEKGLGLALQVDADELQRLHIQIEPPVPYTEVIRKMSTARINIFAPRPFLRHVKYLTQRYFEEFCADTIPLLMLEPDFAEEVYGPAGRELTLPGRVAEKVLDALQRPDHYRDVVEDVRRHLSSRHSYLRRVDELVTALS